MKAVRSEIKQMLISIMSLIALTLSVTQTPKLFIDLIVHPYGEGVTVDSVLFLPHNLGKSAICIRDSLIFV